MASLPDPGHDPQAFGRADRLRCPHCKFAGRRRSSREITPTHRDIYYQCTNLFCGHTWKASETYDYGIVPSAIPDPRVTLPLRAVSRQDAMEITRPATRPSPNCSTAPARPNCPADRPSFLTAATVSAPAAGPRFRRRESLARKDRLHASFCPLPTRQLRMQLRQRTPRRRRPPAHGLDRPPRRLLVP
jgi:hypothetical protein